jgi:Fic-DOC domain mobile mystery protein B
MALKYDGPPGATPLDPDELDGLIPTHITRRGELDEWEAQNILQAAAWLHGRAKPDVLTPGFARQLHKRMFGETWQWAGTFRSSEKNLGIAPAQIAVQTRELCRDVKAQLAHGSMPLDEIAAMFHHRLVSIHLFANGNGRHARMITDALLRINGVERFSWGGGNLNNHNAVRERYIAALRAADGKNYNPLFKFVRSSGSS